jgi:hypothetical protein
MFPAYHPLAFYMHTDDVDAVHQRALVAGATSVLPPADQPFGERLAIVVDPAGKPLVRSETGYSGSFRQGCMTNPAVAVARGSGA